METKKAQDIISLAFKTWAPPPDLSVSEWADRYRYLSAEDSAEPGKWNTERAEYQREIMDAFTDPEVETVVVMTSAQVGKTQILLNVLGRYIHVEPCPILAVQPIDQVAQDFSKDRFAPMVRDTVVVRERVSESKSRDSDNTILHKNFPGGQLGITGANSPSGLCSKPKRLVLMDEVDRYPASAGTEGDPVSLAVARTKNFFNRKIGMFSTPGNEGESRIAAAFEESDQRFFHVPCPECGEFQRLYWKQVKFTDRDPSTSYYECGHCRAHLTDADRLRMIKKGRWIADKPFHGTAGFHLNALYSPWATMAGIVKEHLEALKDTERRKTWVNTTLGETWVEEGDTVDESELIARVEKYPAQVPQGGLYLTAGVDVQEDRLEAEVVAWGKYYENWSIEYRVFYGDTKQPQVWTELDEFLLQDFKHASGTTLNISAACIDSGYNTDVVYDFCKPRASRGVYPVKGVGGNAVPIAGRPSKVKYGKSQRTVNLFPLGVDQAKLAIYSNLNKKKPGPGFCHFPDTYTPEYFDMLTAEKAVPKFVKGFKRIEWKKIRERNEALDCRVYNLAAFRIKAPNLDRMAERLSVDPVKAKLAALTAKVQENRQSAKVAHSPHRKAGGFVKAYKYG
jgi:phage terminase large subunit GpA-like protein